MTRRLRHAKLLKAKSMMCYLGVLWRQARESTRRVANPEHGLSIRWPCQVQISDGKLRLTMLLRVAVRAGDCEK